MDAGDLSRARMNIMREEEINAQIEAQQEAAQKLDPYLGNSNVELSKYMVDPATRSEYQEVNKDLNTSYFKRKAHLKRAMDGFLLFEMLNIIKQDHPEMEGATRLIHVVDVGGYLQLLRSQDALQLKINVTNIKKQEIEEEQKKRQWGMKRED